MSDLKNRKRICTSIDIGIINNLQELSKQTRITMSKLFDEAILDLIQKYK